jgi:pimeloyl-ACP methyl ester carboxylesterase
MQTSPKNNSALESIPSISAWNQRIGLSILMLLTVVAFGFAQTNSKGQYAVVNGLKMYYEIYGKGQPIVVLHGAYMTINLMGKIVPELAKSRQVIAVELQGHGHTADIDRPLSYENMADDVAALLKHLKLNQADLFGYSMGGGVALQVAIRHPKLVRKLVVASATYKSDGLYPQVLEGIAQITPEAFAGSPVEAEYLRTAPNPRDWSKLIEKLKRLDQDLQHWSVKALQSITAPTLLFIGDADVVRPEHTLELFRLLGGGVPGDYLGIPKAQLAVLPGTTHLTILERIQFLLPMIKEFLNPVNK